MVYCGVWNYVIAFIMLTRNSIGAVSAAPHTINFQVSSLHYLLNHTDRDGQMHTHSHAYLNEERNHAHTWVKLYELPGL